LAKLLAPNHVAKALLQSFDLANGFRRLGTEGFELTLQITAEQEVVLKLLLDLLELQEQQFYFLPGGLSFDLQLAEALLVLQFRLFTALISFDLQLPEALLVLLIQFRGLLNRLPEYDSEFVFTG
jgi:hypothetical protein